MSGKTTSRSVEFAIARCRLSGSADLDLAGCDLSKIPDSVRELTHLRTLDLSNNKIESIPAWISELTLLEQLYLNSNPLHTIPTTIGRLSNLHELIIAGGSASAAIESIGELTGLQRLVLVNLGLRGVPSWIRDLRLLESLNLDRNPLGVVPDWIGELTELEILSLNGANLLALPGSLRTLTKLISLNIRENPGLRLPFEIEKSSPARILAYYFLTADPEARQPLNEFKLVLVGRGGVGKTTLVHRLLTDQFKIFRRTPGIKITKWPLKISGEGARAHIWDFGGQEIMHGTHRFFMTERALYLVLLSGREGTEDQDAEYWLSLVRSFAGDVPVIVLLHKSDDYPFELNRALLQEKHGRIFFLATDSETGRGISELRDQITQLAGALPGLKASWPTAWRQVKDDLPRKKKSWLTFADFCAFCKQRGVDSPSDQEALAGYLHDLGLMLAYRRDDTLRKFGVLNPQWATKGIYQMLNARTIRDAGGTFTIKSFHEVLPATAYPESLHAFLLALMIRFRLCHPLDTRGNKYLIPELLGKEEPPLEADFPPAECLSFVYHYASVLPEGLLPRFIVETYVHREPKHAWRSGAILERANCRAMVRGDLQARTVTIRVAGVGNGRRELLGIIREHFERIHASYEKLPVTAKVPVPGHPEIQIDHDDLLAYEQAGESLITWPIGGRIERFEVAKLLDGVDLPGVPRSPRRVGFEGTWKSQPLATFVAYSRKDTSFLDQLRAALVPHERVGDLKLWWDALAEPGQDWEPEILGRLERAQIVILLLSNDFLQSSYCMDKELPRALERRESGECEVIPIVVRACRYDKLDLGKILAIRPGDKSIDEHDKRDPAWEQVTRQIDRVIERIKKR